MKVQLKKKTLMKTLKGKTVNYNIVNLNAIFIEIIKYY